MKNVNLYGSGRCCPSIKEDWERGIMYIVDGDQKIAFTKEQVKELAKYLTKR